LQKLSPLATIIFLTRFFYCAILSLAVINMDKQKHTPGPWRINWGRGQSYPLSIWAMREDGFQNRSIVNAFGCQAQPETDANARLIAAAPDMLAALKLAVADAEKAVNPAARLFAYAEMKAVIDKAEGR
jgi:hypothetical protein